MNTSKLKTYFTFTRQQRSAIFFLLLFIILFQCIYFFIDFTPGKIRDTNQKARIAFQHKTDSLKQIETENRKPKIYPFNPNYITDYKGYTLGMSTAETDRLLAYRKTGKFVNSAKEFQQVTQIPDSLLSVIQPYFKFPAWVTAKKQAVKNRSKDKPEAFADGGFPDVKKDINTVTAQELIAIRGIGEVLSGRIVKFRDRLGGFLVNEQLYDVYGLSAETAGKVLQRYTVLKPPTVKRININTATAKELSSIAYLRYKAAYAVINYRDSIGKIQSLEELTKIPYIPIEKIDRIKLYLKLE